MYRVWVWSVMCFIWLAVCALAAGVYEDTMSTYGYTVPKQHNFYNAGQAYDLVGVYNAGNPCERYTSIPVGTLYDKYCVAQVLVPDPRPGDVLIAHAEAQITSERNTNTEIVSELMFTNGSGGTSPACGHVTRQNGENVDLNKHHHKVHASGTTTVIPGTPSGALRYVSFVVSARNGTTLPLNVQVNAGCATMFVMHFRPRPSE